MKSTITRKLISSLGSASISTLIIPLLFLGNEWGDYLSSVFYAAFFVFPIVFFYGNAVSFVLEFLLRKLSSSWSRALYIVLHLTFGLLGGSIVNIWGYYWNGAIAAGIYVLIDQVIKYGTHAVYRLMKWIAIAAYVLLVILMIVALS